MDIETTLLIEILELQEALDQAIQEDKPRYITDIYHKLIETKTYELELLQKAEYI
jgi:hypothetical protein